MGEVEEALKLSPAVFQERYKAKKPGKQDSDIVFHCRAGMRSRTAMATAHQLGFTR